MHHDDPSSDDIRMPMLKRLAEQAMSDAAFRAVARDDLDAALLQYGYELNPRERDLVFRFRTALDEAGIDLNLKDEIDLNELFDDASPADMEALVDQMGGERDEGERR